MLLFRFSMMCFFGLVFVGSFDGILLGAARRPTSIE